MSSLQSSKKSDKEVATYFNNKRSMRQFYPQTLRAKSPKGLIKEGSEKQND
jgi:hypothetical protein